MPAHLYVRRPSPTTVCFTVSNAPSRQTWSAKLAFAVEILLRAVFFVLVLMTDAAKLRHFVSPDFDILQGRIDWTAGVGGMAARLADRYHWSVIAGASALLIYAVWRRRYTEESLLVIRGLGVQTSTSSSMYWSGATTRFIPTTRIQDIVIHEAFKGFEVRFYLAIIVEGEPEVVVVFPNLLPRRRILEEVWRGARHCLYQPQPKPSSSSG
ncbi:hypothetical protein VTN31DRAFT_1294 [Thermomyces dupontii]|uniref:uncharacterized protein n=1 Tax=Talaromyces thermophilus TaxID=28565 RepID=UPI003742F553